MCTGIPAFIYQQENIICLIWPEEETYLNYPEQESLFSSSLGETATLIMTIVYQLLYTLVWLAVTICNYIMYTRIVAAIQRRKQNRQLNIYNGFEKQLHQVAVMIIANGVVFFMYCSVQFINAIFENIFPDERSNIIWQHFVHLSIGVNSSINPVIYLLTNQRYRDAFKTAVLSQTCRRDDFQTEHDTQPIENISRL